VKAAQKPWVLVQEAFAGPWEFLSGVMAGARRSLLSSAGPPQIHRTCGSALCPPACWGAWFKGAVDGQHGDAAHLVQEGEIKSNAEISFSLTSQTKLDQDLQGTNPTQLGNGKGGSWDT